jgi:hypothetical protein
MLGGVILTEWVLPFLLVFVIIFAILQRSQLLADANPQINVLVSFSVAILSIMVPYSREVIVNIMPWLGVAIVCIFVILLLMAFTGGKEILANSWVKYGMLILATLFSIFVVLNVTGLWDILKDNISFLTGDFVLNAVFVVVILVLMYWVFASSKGSQPDSDKGP